MNASQTILHIAHKWGGGLETWVSDFALADKANRHLVLANKGPLGGYFGPALRLYDGITWKVIEEHTLDPRICEIALEHEGLREILNKLINTLAPDRIIVSSLIGFSLDILDTAVPTAWVHHDFFPTCPAFNVCFGGPCTRCGNQDVTRCVRENDHARAFSRNTGAYWVRIRERLAMILQKRQVLHVYPREGVRRTAERLFGSYLLGPSTVIPHGITHAGKDCFGGAREDRRLRVVVPGRLNASKGLSILLENLDHIRLFADIHCLGCSDAIRDLQYRWGVEATQSYAPCDLTHQLATIQPDVALLLSTVPETFSYTLSEMSAHGIPCITNEWGGFSERISHGHDGFVHDFSREALWRVLLAHDRDRSRLRQTSARLLEKDIRSVHEMVRDHLAAYAGHAAL